METEQKAPVSARIPLDLFSSLYTEIKKTGQNRSEFVQEAIEEKLLNDNKELIEAEIKFLEKRIKILKVKLIQAKEKKSDLNKLSPEETKFLQESLDVLIQNPTFIKGRINLYKNTFSKYYKISEQEFWELLDKVE